MRMAMLLVIATTEAMDPTRVNDPYRTIVDVSGFWSYMLRGAPSMTFDRDIHNMEPKGSYH